jgi:peptidyl-prolyl cis-trans isomerase B (cyclophilin B)
LWGTGGNEIEGSEINIPAEFNDIKHEAGVLSMARSSDPDSASSQFFIMHKLSPHLDGQYSAFGRVVVGQDVVDKIATMPAGQNGLVLPESAVVLKSVKIETWPLKESDGPASTE